MALHGIREWISVLISLSMLIVMIFGLLEVTDIKVNLDKITSTEISTRNITFLDNEGSIIGHIYYGNNSVMIIESTRGYIIKGNNTLIKEENGRLVMKVS